MFHVSEVRVSRGFRFAIGGMALLSLLALVVTAWILSDFQHEQETLSKIMGHLPASDIAAARELAGELRLHAGLSILLILNIIATAFALIVLVRAYLVSERSLRDVKVMATDVLASMDQGVLTTDQNGVILSINPRGHELLSGCNGDVGTRLDQLSDVHATLNDICHDVLRHGDCVRDRDYIAAQDGHSRTLRAGCSLLRDDQHRKLGTVIHLRDVTEKVLIDQRLRRMERYMGLGSLAAGLQHEIKNPLSALSLHVQLLGEALEQHQATPEIREMLDVLHTEVTRITTVLERFRDFASVAQLHRTPVDLPQMISKLVRLIEPQAKQQHVQIRCESPAEPNGESFPIVSADAVGLEQVLLNLAVNALQIMPEGGVLTFRLCQSPEFAQIEVADTGPGIPSDLLERVFDPYFTTRGSGTGMGLAISEKIVRQHDGVIDIATSPAGTTFTVSLPVETAV